jgi:hypothetical protein
MVSTHATWGWEGRDGVEWREEWEVVSSTRRRDDDGH